jgi:hypothetical protein
MRLESSAAFPACSTTFPNSRALAYAVERHSSATASPGTLPSWRAPFRAASASARKSTRSIDAQA